MEGVLLLYSFLSLLGLLPRFEGLLVLYVVTLGFASQKRGEHPRVIRSHVRSLLERLPCKVPPLSDRSQFFNEPARDT